MSIKGKITLNFNKDNISAAQNKIKLAQKNYYGNVKNTTQATDSRQMKALQDSMNQKSESSIEINKKPHIENFNTKEPEHTNVKAPLQHKANDVSKGNKKNFKSKKTFHDDIDDGDVNSNTKANKNKSQTHKNKYDEIDIITDNPSLQEEKERAQEERLYGNIITIKKDNFFQPRQFKRAEYKNHYHRRNKYKNNQSPNRESINKDITVPMKGLDIKDLAMLMSIKLDDAMKMLKNLDVSLNNNWVDSEMIALVGEELGYNVNISNKFELISKIRNPIRNDLTNRTPIVVVMGHVDHGKTSLLDTIKKTNIVSKESGGITQHIGAYIVDRGDGKKITFIDTPGHEAFSSIRSRGSKVTDIAVLVIAADDGINKQTIEAIAHAKSASVPILVAINKIDKPDADIEKVKNELLTHELISEDLGGDVMVIPVSAKTGENLDKLLDAILLQAEIADLKADFNGPAEGVIIEAKVDQKIGINATLLIQHGHMRVGDFFVTGSTSGKIRTMINDKGQRIQEAGPSVPIEITGLSVMPEVGDKLHIVDSESIAREYIELVSNINLCHNDDNQATNNNFDELFGSVNKKENKLINIIIKADNHGSKEAIYHSISNIVTTDEVEIKIIFSGVGIITESDLMLAHLKNSIVLGFNVDTTTKAQELAKKNKIIIKNYSIIYNLIDDVKDMLNNSLKPKIIEDVSGKAEIRQVFDVSKSGKIAGCYVIEGTINRSSFGRIIRNNQTIFTGGKIKSLKRGKEDVSDLRSGHECGIQIENFEDYQNKDIIEVYKIREEQRFV